MTGNPMLDRIILGLCLFVGLSTVGLFVYTENIYKKKLPNNEEETKALLEDSKKLAQNLATYKIEKLVINLPTNSGRMRYLELGLAMTPFKPDGIEILEKNKEMLLDAIISVASGMEAQELGSITGKILLEDRVKKLIHKRLDREVIKEIFFTKFVIQ